jgi:hypothetical protein
MSALIFKILSVLAPALVQVQEQTVIWPFLQIGDFIESTFKLVPYWGIKAIITLFFLSLAVIPFFFSRKYIFEGAEDQSAWRDLRYWALAAAVTEIAVYLYF